VAGLQQMIPTPALGQRLEQFRQERDALQQRIEQYLLADPRVVAAWLFGSLGRGNADALSDLDLFVIIADEDFPAVAAARQQYLSQVGKPLLILEAPQNWPPHGVYNMALYDGADGPHQIDWYWVPQSKAQIPSETLVLFERTPLPRLATPTWFEYAPVPPRSALEVATQQVNMAWVMLLIAAKHLARKPEEFVITPPLDTLQKVAAFLDWPPESLPATTPDHPNALARLDFLRTLAEHLEQMMPAMRARGARMPEAIIPTAARYLDLIEALLSEWRATRQREAL
jgi:predicted nucleotidyltransferase